MKITFLGATETVTGSKYLLESDHFKCLVDCGLFQGYKELRLRNWNSLPIDPHEIDAVILTHAHLDHSGYIPLLVKNGFSGPIYCSPATQELCSILLPDSGYLQEEDARFANKYGFSKHQPALPLYTRSDAYVSLKQFRRVQFDTLYELAKGFSFKLQRAGHLFGAALVEIFEREVSLLFSGDLGRPHDVIMKPPTLISSIDYLVIESTYGDRKHSEIDPEAQIMEIVNQTVKRGGSIVIPAFAVGRAQAIMYHVYRLKKAKKIPNIPVFLDSPMAIQASKVFLRHGGKHRISKEEAARVCESAIYTNTADESKKIDMMREPKIIISASGMATGGRVLHHLKRFITDQRNTILFTGYQAAGTRGDKILKGIGEVKIHGDLYPVRAQIAQMSNVSAHADYREILEWLGGFTRAPKKVFITHGEYESAIALKEKIEASLGWGCYIPHYLDSEHLG